MRRHATRTLAPDRAAALLASIAASLSLQACAAPPERPASAPPAPAAATSAPAPRDPRDVYVYPAQGQSEERLDRDRYECHAWAVKQSGFDPSAPGQPARRQVRVVSTGPTPAEGAAVGAMTGAVLGSVISDPWHAPEHAAIGAVAGAVLGGAAAASREQRVQEAAQAEQSEREAAEDRRADGYRRALGACLDARGYTVR